MAAISARDARQILDDVIHAAGRDGFDVRVLTREVSDLSRIQHLIDRAAAATFTAPTKAGFNVHVNSDNLAGGTLAYSLHIR